MKFAKMWSVCINVKMKCEKITSLIISSSCDSPQHLTYNNLLNKNRKAKVGGELVNVEQWNQWLLNGGARGISR